MSEKVEEKPTSTPVGGGVGVPLGSYYKPEDKVICQYKGNCSDEGYCCKTCRNNTGKRSHYVPDVQPYHPRPHPMPPYVPYIPYIGDPPRPRRPFVWCGADY